MKEVAGINPAWQNDPITLTPYGCTKTLQTWNASPAGRNANWGLKGKVMSIYTTLAGVAQGMDLLKYHGMKAAYQSWMRFSTKGEDGDKAKKSKWRDNLIKSEPFQKMMDYLTAWTRDPEFIGHPKLNYLRQVIMNHLLDSQVAQRNCVKREHQFETNHLHIVVRIITPHDHSFPLGYILRGLFSSPLALPQLFQRW